MTNTKHLEGATCDTPDEHLIPVEALLAGFLRALLREQREGFGALALSSPLAESSAPVAPGASRLATAQSEEAAPRRALAAVPTAGGA